MSSAEQFKLAVTILGFALTLPYAYRAFFLILGFFRTRHFAPARKQHKYGIVIAARNEESVIGELLNSIHGQDYPAELIKVFVVADNCTDRTAAIARRNGAVCYERNDPDHRTKGFALQYLFRCIERDWGTETFDGFFVFDADNLLKKDYISRMNDAFDSGEKIITSYRNTKNFGDNWISCSYGLHWLGTVRTEHRARSVLGLSTRLQGTGYLFDSSLVQNGWNYTSMTEDRELTADAVCRGWRISYQGAAQFFDEQPTELRIALRQRLRWSRGHWEIFLKTGGIFLREMARRAFLPRKKQADPAGFRRLRDVFVCYDIFMTLFPEALLFVLQKILSFSAGIALAVCAVRAGADRSVQIAKFFFPFIISYISTILLPLYVMLSEHRRIPKLSVPTEIFGLLLWPLFPFIGNITMVAAVFHRVEWKPIPHHACYDTKRQKHRCTPVRSQSRASALPQRSREQQKPIRRRTLLTDRSGGSRNY